MCGIAGFCNGSGDPVEKIRRMTDRIVRRGPDSEGYWISDDTTVVLGHRRLSILDCSESGSQPMVSRSGRYVISYNGEIYNHPDIRKELETKGIIFKGTSDTETLLEAFDEYGIENTLCRIKGMFAIALFDNENKILYLMRDRVGEKPLYYGCVNGCFTFASDLSCFQAVYGSDLDIDCGSLELFFRRGYIPAPYSIYRGVYKLEPGHYLRINRPYDRVDDICYWSAFDVSCRCHCNPFRGSINEAEEELERLLKVSLKGQMLSDVPLGAFLSAGIDSSTIVSLMQEVSDNPVKTFTIGVDAPGYDEAPIAGKVSKILGTDHTEEYISLEDIKSVVPSVASMYSEPFADSSQIPTSIISQVARKKVTVVLSGDGGDELFCGYERYNGWVIDEWKKQQRFPNYIQRLRANALALSCSGRSSKAKKLMSQSLPQLYAAVSGGDTGFVKTNRIYKDYYDRFDRYDFEKLQTDQDILMQMDFGEYLPDDILAKVDRAAMFHSLETRIPFLDKDVMEFVWTLPLEMKYNDGVTKRVLRNILYKCVPRNIIERPKTGFSIPLGDWMRQGDLREWAESLFSLESLKSVEDYIDINECKRMWCEYVNKNIWDEKLWFITIFLQWFDKKGEA